MKRISLLFALLTPLPAAAQGFGAVRWDYVTGNLAVPELDEIGIEIAGSTAVTNDLVVFGYYRDFEPDEGADRKTLAIGVGHRWNVRPAIDVLASIAYADNEIDVPGIAEDEEGVVLGGHVRGWASQRMELNGAVLLDNSAGSSTETVVEVGAQYFRARNWSYGGRVRAGEDDTALFLGVQFYFGASRR
jgi:hypothetical protein